MSKTPYRIAVREEGPNVNAYWARTETMEGAELVASLNRQVAHECPEIASMFMALMQCVAAELATARLGGTVVGMNISEAPQHEKAGHA